jgi:fructose-bisphosphate aldolase class II
MLDLSEEFDEENIATCVKYFKRMSAVKLWLEMEIGITGGEEDGVDNTGVKADALYTKPEQVKRFLLNKIKCRVGDPD